MKVYITGATGLVGSHTAAQLVERGHSVRALVRATSDTSFLGAIGAELVTGDIADPPLRLAAGIRGCDAVVHSAAIVYPGRTSWERYEAANVAGTRNVLEAAAAANVPRCVHVSSIAVYGGSPAPGEQLDEAEWLRGDIAPGALYPRSKRAAEQAAWALHERGDIALSTARPGVIYGERDRLFTAWLARAARARILPLPRGGEARAPLVYAGNVAWAIIAMLEREASVGRAYNLSADGEMPLRALIVGLGEALGRPPRIVRLPGAPLKWLAAATDAILSAVPGMAVPQASRAARTVLHDHPYSNARAREELGWRTPVPVPEALGRTAAWLEGEPEVGR